MSASAMPNRLAAGVIGLAAHAREEKFFAEAIRQSLSAAPESGYRYFPSIIGACFYPNL
jgi:hypothetical protein